MSDRDLKESVSALVDGELPPARAARALDAVLADPRLREQWRREHRLTAILAGHYERDSDGLADRVRAALEREPVALAPPPPPPRRPLVSRRRATALAAGIAALAVLVGVLVADRQHPPPAGERVARVEPDTLPPPQDAAPALDREPDRARPAPAAAVDAPVRTALARMAWNDAGPAVEKRLNGYLLNHNEYLAGGVRGFLPYARVVGYDARD